jgi:polyhydroxybutyrate depolymerase
MRVTDTTDRHVHALRHARAVLVLAVGIAVVTVAGGCANTTAAASRTPRTATRARRSPPPAGQDVATRPATREESWYVAARPYTLHVPPVLQHPAPLLIVLHGYGANGASQAIYFGITPVTDARGMLLAVVEGTRDTSGRQFWNATDACCGSSRSSIDDSSYLRAVIADVAKREPVDPKRVFILGHSNGGFMAYRMACDHADVVAAIVSLEAATWNDPARCRPSESVAVLEIHGTDDETIAYDGGTLNGHRYPGARATVRSWARKNGCRLRPDRPAPPPRDVEVLRPPATVTSFSTGCRGNGHVELWTQAGGTHVPPLAASFAAQVVDDLLTHPKP